MAYVVVFLGALLFLYCVSLLAAILFLLAMSLLVRFVGYEAPPPSSFGGPGEGEPLPEPEFQAPDLLFI